MKKLGQKGIALVMVLLVAAIALSVMASLLYIIGVGTKMIGVEKRYESALSAAESTETIAVDVIDSRGIKTYSLTMPSNFKDVSFTANPALTNSCALSKILNSTASWGSTCDRSFVVNSTSYDFKYTVGGSPSYDVYAKIVNTVEGNSASSVSKFLNKGVVANSNEFNVPLIPYLYMIETVAINNANSAEKARVSVLYQY